MKPLRFLLCFLAAYALGFITSAFFSFAAKVLRDVDLVYGSFGLAIILIFVFAWLYFKGVPQLNWRHRIEAVLVWFLLVLTLDTILLFFFYKQSLRALSTVHVIVYCLVLLALFAAAYVQAPEHPKLSSPDLMHPDGGAS